MMLLMMEEYGDAGDAFNVPRFATNVTDQFLLAGQSQNEWQKLIDELTDATTDFAVSEAILPIITTGIELSEKTIEIIKQFEARYADTQSKRITAPELLIKLLTADALPDEIKGISDNERYLLVKTLLLTTYRKDIAGVRELLRLLPVQSAEFITLYRLFSKAATIEERSVFYLIKKAAEEKLLHWWQQAGVNVEANASENLQEVIDAVMMHERGEVFTRLLKKDVLVNWLLPVSLPYIPDQSVDGLLEIMLPGTTRS